MSGPLARCLTARGGHGNVSRDASAAGRVAVSTPVGPVPDGPRLTDLLARDGLAPMLVWGEDGGASMIRTVR